MNKSPKISIITVAYNSGKTISNTIDSVLSQEYDNIEYIIIDGGSTDKTNEIIESYGEKISHYISEKDNGIYDAMNKGIQISTGKYIGIINSDDFYPNSNIIQKVVNKIKEEKSDCLYADLVYVDFENVEKIKRYWKSGEFNRTNFTKGWMIPHPTFFVSKEIYNTFGLYNLSLKSSSDYEMILRLLYKNQVSVSYLPEVTVHMRDGGYSNQNVWSRLRGNNEDLKAWELNNLKKPRFIRFLKPLVKVKQFFLKPKV
jgi:glycosyltransferase involved in cell wall biosynthesis